MFQIEAKRKAKFLKEKPLILVDISYFFKGFPSTCLNPVSPNLLVMVLAHLFNFKNPWA
jgi:hypothetical protein